LPFLSPYGFGFFESGFLFYGSGGADATVPTNFSFFVASLVPLPDFKVARHWAQKMAHTMEP